jgi:hypothetical protein
VQEELDKERDQCRRLVDAEKRDVLAAKDKMQAQIAQLKAAHEEVNCTAAQNLYQLVSCCRNLQYMKF